MTGFQASDSFTAKYERQELLPGNEWRFEVPFDGHLQLKLISGTAEFFGTELAIGNEVTFVGRNGALFTWQGCTFEWRGSQVSEYVSDETPMVSYVNLHFALETIRRKYQQSGSNSKSPSVLILGSEASGKTTLCRILASYANNADRFPLYINLDPKEGAFAPSGGLTATPISDILDIEEGWGVTTTNGPTLLHPKNPLVYYYGFENTSVNLKYYKHQISKLAEGAVERMRSDSIVRNSGMIIDTPGGLLTDKNNSYSTIEKIVSDFQVTAIVIISQERLYSDILKKFKDKVSSSELQVVKVPKSGGCVERTDSFMRAVQSRSIREYFYGTPKQPFAPKTITVDYSLVTVYRIDENQPINSAFLPDADGSKEPGGSTAISETDLIKLETSAILQNCVMAMLNANVDDPPEVLINAEVLGFVHVVDADDTRKKLKILMPVSGRLPNRPFVIGEYRYHE